MRPKSFILCCCMLLLVSTGCTGEDQTSGYGMNLPNYADMQLGKVLYSGKDELLLGWYSESAEASPQTTVLAHYDLSNGECEELFAGDLGNNFFYDVLVNKYADSIVLHEGFANDKLLVYLQEERQLTELPVDTRRFTTLLPDGSYLFCADDVLYISKPGMADGVELATLYTEVIAYDLNPDGIEWVGLSHLGDLAIVNLSTDTIHMIAPQEQPEGWVDYDSVSYSADGKFLILTVPCEDSTIFQVINKENGLIIGQYDSIHHDGRLLQVCDSSLLIADGEKMAGQIIAWDYLTDEQTVVFDTATDYGGEAYINSAALSPAGDRLAVALWAEDGNSLRLYPIP